MKKLFGELKMSWLTVILFAVIAGVYTGIVMLIPFLKGTSFQDIGISFEWWVIFAVIIVVNCKKCWEAMLKCSVFFLVSQPIIYLVQILFGSMTLDMAWYYYRSSWLLMTFLTLPGGLIAYFCKKQNVLGAVILAFGNTIQALLALYYLQAALNNFPHHLLSTVVSAGSIIVMSIFIQKKTMNRLIAILLPVALGAAALVLSNLVGFVIF